MDLEERRRLEVSARAGTLLRQRLLDLSGRNNLISFRHQDRRLDQVRVIDELPDHLYERLLKGRPMHLIPLPDPATVDDEATPFFKKHLEAACYQDPDFLAHACGDAQKDEPLRADVARKLRRELGWPDPDAKDMHQPETIARLVGLNPNYDLPESLDEKMPVSRHHGDQNIQTLLFPTRFDRKLLGLYRKANLIQSETGISALYAAFGFLKWPTEPGSDKTLLSPLLLLPLSLLRKTSEHGYVYTLQLRDEEPVVNPSLAARLLRDLGLILPELREDHNPGTYMAAVRRAIGDRVNMEMRRYVTIGLFSFSRIAMYHDLDHANWPGPYGVWKHGVLAELLTGRSGETLVHDQETALTEADIDPLLPLAADADSSQALAVQEVLSGRSLVIEGPPGTGKSQTITNIIAACLARGKRVLFVAEKAAALDVVRRRLEDIGLHPFCLDLHSTKSGRQAVMAQLKRRLDQDPQENQPAAPDQNPYAQPLQDYYRQLHQPVFVGGPSPFTLIWQSADDASDGTFPEAFCEVRLYPPNQDRDAWYATAVDYVTRYAGFHQHFLQGFGPPTEHPWYGMTQIDSDEAARERLFRAIKEVHTALHNLINAMAGIQGSIPIGAWTYARLRSYLEGIRLLMEHAPEGELDVGIMAQLKTPTQAARLLDVIDHAEAYAQQYASLHPFLPDLNPEDSGATLTLLRDLQQCLRALEPMPQNLEALRADLQAHRQQIEAVDGLQNLVRHLCTYFDIGEDPPTLYTLRCLVTTIDLATELTPEQRLLHRPAHTLAKNSRILHTWHAHQQALDNLAAELSPYLNLNPAVTVQKIRTLSKHLEKGAPWTWFGEGLKAAKMWSSLSQKRSKLSLKKRVHLLCRLADYVERKKKFNLDKALRSACGHAFDGHETPLSDLVALSEWATEVRSLLSVAHPDATKMRHRLLKGKDGEVESLAALTEHDDFIALKEVIAGKMHREKTLQELRIYHQQRVELLSRAESLSESLCWGARIPFENLAEIIERMTHYNRQLTWLKQAPESPSILGLADWRQGGRLKAIRNMIGMAAVVHQQALPKALTDGLFQKDGQATMTRLATHFDACSRPMTVVHQALERLSQGFPIDAHKWCRGADFYAMPLQALQARMEQALAHPEALPHMEKLLQWDQALATQGLQELTAFFYKHRTKPEQFTALFQHAWGRTLLDQVQQQRPALAPLRNLDTLRAQFMAADSAFPAQQVDKIVDTLLRIKPEQGKGAGPKRKWTGLHLVRNEAGKVTRHLAVRQLLLRAGKTVQQLTPCFLMSPLSVAHYLPANTIQFDVVVMDEASQMRPEDALSAIARGQRLVVVGDPKQLGPSDFFHAAPKDDPDDIDNPLDASILEAAMGVYTPVHRLKWHYRSQHQDLIRCANRLFYDNQLVMIPNAEGDNPCLGFHTRFVPDGVYHKSVNRGEAEAVVRALQTIMAREPERSVGIVTVNQSQQELIEDLLTPILNTDPSALAYVAKHQDALEDLFVKNLENVQGDERDIILVSTVYGRDREGRFYKRFGPIVQRDGHRRLNVLFTRARRRLMLFTSIKPEWIEPDADTGSGIRALHAFIVHGLPQARDQRMPLEDAHPFTRTLQRYLATLGYTADIPDTGEVRVFDLMVRHPHKPGAYCMAVCGDQQRTGVFQSVRDRERLRLEVLQRMGWQVHTIWSHRWHADPEGCKLALKRHLDEVLGD